jgi:hypothetical protein
VDIFYLIKIIEMIPNSSLTSYISPADMILRNDPRLMAQLCTDNPFQPVIYSPFGPLTLGTCSVVFASNQITFTIPQSGIQGSTCQFSGDSSGQTYIIQSGNITNFIISPVYGGSSSNSSVCTIVPVDTLSTEPKFLTALSSASGELESACLRSKIYSVSDLQSLNGVSLEYLKDIVSRIAMMKLYKRRNGPNPSETTVEEYNSAMKSLEELAGGTRIFAFNETEEAGLPANFYMNPWNQIQNRMVSSTWQRSFGVRQNMRYAGGFNNGGGITPNQSPG